MLPNHEATLFPIYVAFNWRPKTHFFVFCQSCGLASLVSRVLVIINVL